MVRQLNAGREATERAKQAFAAQIEQSPSSPITAKP
jgi:hypothetical protein